MVLTGASRRQRLGRKLTLRRQLARRL